ncbi:hypothetical protein [Bombella apis]|uniref:hypothetical protein n=1 Tax=Bombella apis TaxID=1785988 RepID=UPI0012B7FF68|nr:hypothetical protein [Bombella apis]MPV99728.1 hypothetical protein [Bombella apis]
MTRLHCPSIAIILLALAGGGILPARAQGFYGGSEYLLSPPPPPPPPTEEFTHLPPPPPPPPSFSGTWQQDQYRQQGIPAPWAAPLWGTYQTPRYSRQNGWDEPGFMPWNTYIQTQAPYPGLPYPPAPPSRSCIDQNCTGP